MKRSAYLTLAAAWLVLGAMIAPRAALGVTPNHPTPLIADVALRDGGVLLGQVVKSDGKALPSTLVSLRNGDQQLATSTTDPEGYFAFSGLKTGTYQVATTGGAATYQLWNADAAPPAAQRGALLVTNGDTVRGQGGPFQGLFVRPILLGGVVAAAVAVPVAVSNSHRRSASAN